MNTYDYSLKQDTELALQINRNGMIVSLLLKLVLALVLGVTFIATSYMP